MSGYLTHSVSSTGNRKIFTISAWVKVNANTVNQTIFGAGTAGSNSGKFYFAISNGVVRIGGGANVYLVTNRVFRDPSSWYHFVCAVDTSQGTSSNRIKFYVNGLQETSFSTSTYTSQDQNTPVNESGKINTFGAEQGGGESWDGYMTHMVLVDGAQLTASNFGETDSTTGEWKPKADPTGVTYGTNGVFMKCENSGNFGLDSSGQGNNYTANSFPTGAFTTDSASNNFATLAPNNDRTQGGFTFSEGNLKVVTSGSNRNYATLTQAFTSGKWYMECRFTGGADSGAVGVCDMSDLNMTNTSSLGDNANEIGVNATGAYEKNNVVTSGWAGTFTTNDVLGLCLDCDNNRFTLSKNGQFADGSGNYDEANPTAYLTYTAGNFMTFAVGERTNAGTATCQINIGNSPYTIASGNADAAGHGNFEYAVPSGYFAPCTKNLNTYG